MKKIYRKFGFVCFMFFAALMPVAAGDVPGELEDAAQKVYDIFQSPLIKIILAIMLCGSAVAYAFNKDNDKVKRNCIAVGVSAILIIASTQIVEIFWTK